MEKRIYYAATSGYINGAFHTKDEPVGEMTGTEVKYLLMSGQVTDKKPRATPAPKRSEPDPASLEKKTR